MFSRASSAEPRAPEISSPERDPGEGIGDDGQWAPELSLLVLGIDRNDARRLGRQYGQLAVIYGELNREAELLMCGEAPGR